MKNISNKHLNTHSEKFIRLARFAKLSKISSLQSFTFFNNQEKKSSKKKEICLLFLNQGLITKDFFKLRSFFKMFGLQVTQIPSRFWSNSRVLQRKDSNKKISSKLRKSIHGNLLCIHASFSNTMESDKLCFIALNSINKMIQKSLIEKDYSSIGATNHFKELFNHVEFKADKKTSTAFKYTDVILPWDNFSSSKTIHLSHENNLKQLVFDSWITTASSENTDKWLNHIPINLILNYLKEGNLIYAGMLNVKNNLNSHLFFDNLYSFQLKNESNLKLSSFSIVEEKSINILQPFFLSTLNGKYLFNL